MTRDCLWHSEDKKGINTKSVYNKCCLCQTNFSYNNGKRFALSIAMCHSFQWHNYKEWTRSTDKLAPVRDEFESVKRFRKAYTPNECVTICEELVVFREKCPFYMFMKSKLGKCGLLVMQRSFMPRTCKYTLARLMEQGRRSRAFVLSNVWAVTCMELEEVLLLISLKVVN